MAFLLLILLVLVIALPVGMAMGLCPDSMASCPAGLASCALLLGTLIAVGFVPLWQGASSRNGKRMALLLDLTLEHPPQG